METRHDLSQALNHWENVIKTISGTVELHLVEIAYLRGRVDALENSLRNSIEWAKDTGGDLAAKEIEKWSTALDPRAKISPEDFRLNENQQRQG